MADDTTHGDYGMRGYGASTYGDAFADVYDEWYETLDDADFVDAVVESLPSHGARVLELGAGTGRLLDALHRARANVPDVLVGVDSSEAMIERGRARLGDRARLVRADFSSSLPDGPFDVVFAGYNTLFNLPDDAALDACLALVSSRLAVGGAFLVDVAVPATDNAGRDHVGVRSMSTEAVVLSVTRVDRADQRIVGHFVQLAQGLPVRLRPWSIRYWTAEQMDLIAARHGLRAQRRGADGHWNPAGDDVHRYVTLYRRIA